MFFIIIIGIIFDFRIIQTYAIQNATIVSILITFITASIIVGGKMLVKAIALLHFEEIINFIDKFINFIEKKFNIKFFLIKRLRIIKNF